MTHVMHDKDLLAPKFEILEAKYVPAWNREGQSCFTRLSNGVPL